jgi:hypothetical protein
MTNAQLYLAIGMPVLAVLVGIFVNSSQINVLNARMSFVETRMTNLENRFIALEAKIDAKFDLLIGKIFEFDNRLSRLEERLKH